MPEKIDHGRRCLDISSRLIGSFIGAKGRILKCIQNESRARISVSKDNLDPSGPQCQVVHLSGSPEEMDFAVFMIRVCLDYFYQRTKAYWTRTLNMNDPFEMHKRGSSDKKMYAHKRIFSARMKTNTLKIEVLAV